MSEAMSKVRDYIALIMTIGILLMIAFKVVMPDRIWDIYMMVIAFFFGSKSSDVAKDTTTITTSKIDKQEVKP